MKTYSVKQNITKLVHRLGGNTATAKKLDVSVRYIELMLQGQKVSSALASVIRSMVVVKKVDR
jgi:hypothetical protein